MIYFAPGKPATDGEGEGSDVTASENGENIKISGCKKPDGVTTTIGQCAQLIGSNIGEKNPKAKYQKNIDVDGNKSDSGFKPTGFVAFVTTSGSVYVCVTEVTTAGAKGSSVKEGPSVSITDGVATFTGCAPLAPELCKGYQ